MSRRSQRLFTALAVLAIVTACGGTTPSSSGGGTQANVSLKIMVGGLNKQIYLPNMLAKQLGYFDAEKINITLVDEGSGQGTELEVVADVDRRRQLVERKMPRIDDADTSASHEPQLPIGGFGDCRAVAAGRRLAPHSIRTVKNGGLYCVIRIGGPIDERFVHEREPWDFDALHAASTCATGLARRISRA